MRGTIQIGEKSFDMVANGATPFIYKKVFHKDFLVSTQNEDLDAYTELAFVMAMQAEKPLAELVNGLKYEDFLAWVEGFEAMDLFNKAPDIFAIYQAQAKQTSVPKKKNK